MTDAELLARILDEHEEELCSRELAAFSSMRVQTYPFTQPQLDWIRGVGEKLGIQVAPARNSFSAMTPEKQAEHLKQAERVKLPWERGAVALPKKPPRRK